MLYIYFPVSLEKVFAHIRVAVVVEHADMEYLDRELIVEKQARMIGQSRIRRSTCTVPKQGDMERRSERIFPPEKPPSCYLLALIPNLPRHPLVLMLIPISPLSDFEALFVFI